MFLSSEVTASFAEDIENLRREAYSLLGYACDILHKIEAIEKRCDEGSQCDYTCEDFVDMDDLPF